MLSSHIAPDHRGLSKLLLKINAMQYLRNYGLYLTRTVRFLAGSRFLLLAFPSSHSYGYAFQSKAAPVKNDVSPKTPDSDAICKLRQQRNNQVSHC